MKIVSSFTHSQVVLNLNEFLSSVKQKLFWKMWETKQLLVPSDFHIYLFFPTIKVSGDQQLFGYPHV